jgi:plastocyanin
MRRLGVVLVLLGLTFPVFAKDVYLSITGKANGFFTDARIFNPSFDKDITIQARYLPANNQNNSNVQPVTLTIPKRSMKVYDDAVQSMFGGGPALGAIRLTSDDDFVASQRIYQDARAGFQKGTLGQFVPGLDLSAAKTKGVLLQLKSGDTTLGPFRTNFGGANPNGSMAHVTMKLYDKNNAVVAEKLVMFEPFGVLAPASIVGTFNNTNADLTDAWISFTSDVPVFVYCSAVDSSSSDPTFIPAADDSGTPPPPPPPPETKVVNIHAEDGFFSADGTGGLEVGDEVRFVGTGEGGPHGFRLFSPGGQVIVSLDPLSSNPTDQTITLTAPGTYQYVCTRPTCSAGHTEMVGAFNVGQDSAPDDPRDRY